MYNFQTREKASRNKSTNYTIVINLWFEARAFLALFYYFIHTTSSSSQIRATVHTYMYIRCWDDAAGFSCDVYGYRHYEEKKRHSMVALAIFFFMNGRDHCVFYFFFLVEFFCFFFVFNFLLLLFFMVSNLCYSLWY